MANWGLPTLTSTYANFVAEMSGRLDDLALGLAGAVAPTNLPENSIKWNITNNRWEKWVGGFWVELTTVYNINVASAPKLTTPKNIALSGHVNGTIGFDGSIDVTILTTLAESGATAGLYGSSTAVPILTVDSKGRITSVSTAPIGSSGTIVTNNATITGGSISGTVFKINTAAPSAEEGYMTWDPTDDLLKIGNGLSGIKTYVDTATAQVLQNKEMSTGSVWNGTPIAVGFGGTGANNVVTARDNLGLSTMSTQASNAVNITGGAITNTAITLFPGTGNTAEGQLQWDGVNNLLSIGTSTGSKVMVDLDNVQALLNKTINGVTLNKATTGFTVAGGISSKTLTIENSLKFLGTDNTIFTMPSTSGSIPLVTQQFYLGSTPVAINRTIGAIALTGITSIDGLAATATKLAATKTLNGTAFDGSININTIPLSVVDDTTTATIFYPVITSGTTGNPAAKVSSSKLSFTPSTGRLSATSFGGDGSALSNIGTAALGGNITALAKTVLQGTTTENWRTNIAAAAEVSKQTIWVPAGAMQGQLTSPPTKVIVELGGLLVSTWNYPYDTNKFLQFSVRMPKGWDRGAIQVAFRVSRGVFGANPNASATSNWGVGMYALNTHGSGFTPVWVEQFIDANPTYQDSLYESALTAGAVPGVQVGQTVDQGALVCFRIFRNTAVQTYTADTRLHGVVIGYNTTTMNDV